MPAAKGSIPWNAGTSKGWVDSRGYRWLYVTENGKRRARREHRVIMEMHLGRRLEPWEIVHHKDHDTGNNAIENLQVMEFGAHTAGHSKGARKDADARQSMQAFGLMREELKAERAIKAELLAALLAVVRICGDYIVDDRDYDEKVPNQWQDDQHAEAIQAARDAIKKATGETI